MADLETRLAKALRPTYRYRVVSSNGAGIYGPDWCSLAKAKDAAERQAARPLYEGQIYEIERLLKSNSSCRYWMMRGKRWVPYDARQDFSDRKPALFWRGSKGSSQ